MNRIHYNLFMCFFLLITFSLSGQTNIEHITKEHIENNITKHQLTANDVKEWRITSDHVSSLSGVHHIYGIQQYNGLDIDQAVFSLHLKNNREARYNNSFINNISSKVNSSSSTPSISAINALRNALSTLHLSANKPITIAEQKSNTELAFKVDNRVIPANLIYYKTRENKLALAWDFRISDLQNKSSWRTIIDANSGQLLLTKDMVVSCGHIEHNSSDDPLHGPIYQKQLTNHAVTTLMNPPNQQYTVFKYPAESAHDIDLWDTEVNPYDPIASPNGWHHENTFTTSGNNVIAFSNDDINSPPSSPWLYFSYNPDPQYTNGNADPAAVTNLFYWTNLCHDIFYHHGFDQAADNFEGQDRIEAIAHHGIEGPSYFNWIGSNNTPTIMMGGWFGRDSSFDNMAIIHEYGHGVNRRIVGGSGNTNIFNNAEHMDEGWADWFGLMFTMKIDDTRSTQRSFGTWEKGEGPNGPGYRDHKYNADPALNINPDIGNENYFSYDDIVDYATYDASNQPNGAYQHKVGAVWAAMLWEMTWQLIDDYGFDSNLYSGNGGNNIALSLVIEGLKNTGINPGFGNSFQALLDADQDIYDGQYSCYIKEAFRLRGFGEGSSQGLADDVTDGISTTDPYECEGTCITLEISNADDFPTTDQLDLTSNEDWFTVQAEILVNANYDCDILQGMLDDGTVSLDIIRPGFDPIYTVALNEMDITCETGLIQLSIPINLAQFINYQNWYDYSYDFELNVDITYPEPNGTNCSDTVRVPGISLSDLFDCTSSSITMDSIPNCSADELPFNVTGTYTLLGGYLVEAIELVVTNVADELDFFTLTYDFSQDTLTEVPNLPSGLQSDYSITVNPNDFTALVGNYTFQVQLVTSKRGVVCQNPVGSEEETFAFDCDDVPWCENRLDITSEIPTCDTFTDPDHFNFTICGIFCVAQSNNTFLGLELEVIPAGSNTGFIFNNPTNPSGDNGGFCFNIDETSFQGQLSGSYTFVLTASYLTGSGNHYDVVKTAGELNFDDCLPEFNCVESITPNGIPEHFETDFGSWLQSTDDTLEWVRHNGNDGNGPPNGSQGSTWFAHLFSETEGNANSGILVSPCIDLSTSQSASIAFDYFSPETFPLQQGTLNLEVSTDNGVNWDPIEEIPTGFVISQSWTTITSSLNEYISDEPIRLRFTRTSPNGIINVAIDNININHEEVEEEVCPDGNIEITSITGDCETLLNGGTIQVSGTICYEEGQSLSNLNLQIINDSGDVVGLQGVGQGNPTNGNTEFTYYVSINDFDNTPQGNYTFRATAFFTNGSVSTGSDFDQAFGVSFDGCGSDPCDGINITITNEDDIPNCTDLGDPWVFDLDVLVTGLPDNYTQQEAVADILNNYTLDVIDLNNNDNILVTLNQNDIVPNSGFFGNGSVGVSYRLSSNGNMSNIIATTYAFRISATLNIDTIECPLIYTAYELSFEECEEPSCDDMAVSIPSGIPHCGRIIANPSGYPICVDYVIPQGYQPESLTLSFNQVNGSDEVILPISANNITVTGTDQQGNGIGSYCFTITESLFQTPVQGVYNVNTTLVIESDNGDECDIELPEQLILDFTDCEPEFSCEEVSVTLASEIPKCDVILGSESFQLCLDYVLPFGYQDPVTLELIFTQQEGGGDQFSYAQEGLPISGTDTNGNSTGTFCFTVNTSDFENPFDGYYAIDAVIQVTTPDNRTCGTKLDTQRLSFRDCEGLCIPSTEFWISENKILNWNGFASSYTLAIQEDPNCNGILDGPTIPQIHYFTVEGNSFNLADIIGEIGRCILFQIKSDCQLTPWCPAQARRGIWSLPKDCLDNEDLCPPIRTEIDGNKYFWDDVAESYDIEIIGDDTCSNGSDGEMLSEWITTTENSLNLDEISARFGKCFKIRIYYSRECPPTECLIQFGESGYEKDGACSSGINTRIITKSNILKVFPNPASNKITVSSEHLEITSIALFNFYGKPIETFNTIKTLKKQIDLSRLSSGYYMLKVVFEDGSVQYKNVIIK